MQRPGEKAEMFIRALYEMSEHCDFGVNRDEHIRDRIVVGILDKELSRKLQMMADLTLAQTIQTVRQSEEVVLQVHQQGEAHATVQEIQGKAAGRGRSPFKPRKGKSGEQKDSWCGRCGKLKHRDPEKCPAMKSTCNKCKKVGHWEKKCHSKSVREVTEETVSQTPFFLGAVTKTDRNDDPWTIQLTIGTTPVNFKIDTGADANIMGQKTFNELVPKKELEPSNVTLCSPGGQLDCIGKFQAFTEYKEKPYTFPVYVISGNNANNLLGRDTAMSMGLVKRVEEVHKAFGEHGTLKTEPVKILLKENAQPYTVHTARRVPLPLLQKVKEELQRMEENNVIEAVIDPTDWCAPMVPVPRKNGKVRICVDLKRLNEAVRRERYVLPTAEEITAKLSGATTFTSLDAASGFWQIPLHPESSKLTTFITPFGRYAFKRLPFGITSAPEIFQRKMTETLNGLEGVAIYMDDILVYGDTPEQHDQRLSKVLERIESAGLKLNREKCKFRQNKLHFLGQEIDKSGVRPDPDKVKAIRELPPPQNVHDLKRVLGMFNYLRKIDTIKTATAADCNLQLVLRYIKSGWPEYIGNVPAAIRDYFPIKNELSECDGIITRGSRMLIPDVLRADILDRIHDGHQGLTKCRERACTSVWWPGISSEIKRKVQSCQVCREMRPAQRKEPLLSTPLPDRPWKRLAVDLCEHNKHTYLVVSDYFSRFLEILHLPVTTASQMILKLKAVFARFGCPDVVVSDNGPQFSCQEFKKFAREFDFLHITSSPHNPQGNGHAERGVQTAKRILKQQDPLLALMCFRSTPCTTTGVSPAELLMGRKIKTTLPTLEVNLQPRWPDLEVVRNKDAMEKQKQAFYFNQRHGAKPLPSLKPGDSVLTKLDHQKSWKTPAVVTGESSTPRSFLIETPQGATLRRNRRHLQHDPESAREIHSSAPNDLQPEIVDQQPETAAAADTILPESSVKPPDPKQGLLFTRSGRMIKPVQRLDL